MTNVYLVSSVRTPIGRFGGTLASWSAADLGVAAAKESIQRANLTPDQIQQSIWGCARQAGGGPNIARQITYRAGVPETAPAFTVNQACGSGLQAIMLAAQQIILGRAEIVLAGGTESMSRVPYFAEGARWGMRMGNTELVNGMYRDGFNDPLSGLVMGETAENLAREYGIDRDCQDAYALRSQRRTAQAQLKGWLAEEITPVRVPNESIAVSEDEHPRPNISLEKLAKLKPLLGSDSTITAGNASGLNDGACALLLASDEALNKHGLQPLARVISMASAGVAPRIMGIGPVPAIHKLLAKIGLGLDDFNRIEINEAFAAQVLACTRSLGLADDAQHVNSNGGALALGHPLGASGARLVMTAAYALRRQQQSRALVSLCVGVGQGVALALERA